MPITTKGGVRKGAGRPKGTIKGQGIKKTMSFPPEVWAEVVDLAKLRAMKPTDLIRQIVECYLKG